MKSHLYLVTALLTGVCAFSAMPNSAEAAETIRIEAGGSAAVTIGGNTWEADRGFIGGTIKDRGSIAIDNTTDDRLYQTERYGMTGYSIPVDNGIYTVKLYFAENFAPAAGKRIFGVNVEGQAINDLNVSGEAGGINKALVKTLTGVAVNDGTMDINFSGPGVPIIDAIEIVPPPPPPVNGACGPADGVTVAEKPTMDLCSAGIASTVVGEGPWSWSCAGLYGGSTASCSALKMVTGHADIIINYASASSPGPLKHVASGFLHGFEDSFGKRSPIAPSSLYSELSPTWLRTRPSDIIRYYNEDSRLRGGPSNAMMVATLSGSWGYPKTGGSPPWGSDYNNPDYSAWLNYVVRTVNTIKASGIPVAQRVYDFWNEPNNGDFYMNWDAREKTSFPRFKECYRLTYKLIKEGLPGYNGGRPLDPTAKISGPGTSVGLNQFNETFTTEFMRYAKDNNVVPDLWNWHFGDPYTLREFNERMDYAASIGVARDAIITEYLRKYDGQHPGRAIYELALLESATSATSGKKIVGAMHARWPETDELGNAIFLQDGAWKKHGMWYVYESYAAMTGQEATFTSVTATPKVGAVASLDSSSKKAWGLLGNDVFDTKFNPTGVTPLGFVDVQLDGIKAADTSGKVYVTLSRIPYNDFGEVTDTDVAKVYNNAPYTVIGNTITVTVPWGRNDNGYFLEISNVLPR